MINKHLLKFNTDNEYRRAKNNGFDLPNVSYVSESNTVYINRLDTKRENAEAGDIIACRVNDDGTCGEVAYFKPDAYRKEMGGGWIAQAIVVIPLSHTNDGTIKGMAVNYANLTTPHVGGNASGIVWGGYIDIANIPNHTGAIKFPNYDNQGIDGTFGAANGTYIPSDDFTNDGDIPNPYDQLTSYKATVTTNYSPSPYAEDGSVNDAYRSLGGYSSLTNNCLSDMDGYGNTYKILTSLDTRYLDQTFFRTPLLNKQSDVDFDPSRGFSKKKIGSSGDTWYDADGVGHTATTEDIGNEVDDYSEARIVYYFFPAACACARYSTVMKPYKYDASMTLDENLMAGNMPWYLPSAGEVGYMIARQGAIKLGLQACGNGNGYSTDWMWSSSEYNGNSAWTLRPSDGYVYGSLVKTNQYRVRPFAAF